MKAETPVLIHVPHASTFIPSDEWQYFVTPHLKREILCMTDHYCNDLFKSRHEMICFPISRLVCDVERFRDDAKETMSLKGMGVVYTKCSDGSLLKQVSEEHKNRILAEYYDRHHAHLTDAVDRRLQEYGRCTIIDGHSFHETPLPYEYDHNPERADICIGTDDFHTPAYLLTFLKQEFQKRGYSVAVNTPFSGTMVPGKHYRKDPRVSSVMIEINRKLYMDSFANPNAGYDRVKKDIGEILEEIL